MMSAYDWKNGSASDHWRIVNVDCFEIGYRAIVSYDDDVICHPSPMGERNARLIVSAPDMLRVMRELLSIARKHEMRDCILDADHIIRFIES